LPPVTTKKTSGGISLSVIVLNRFFMSTGTTNLALRRWLPVVGWAVLIFVGSTARIKGPAIEVPGIGLDKIVHFTLYFLLTALLLRALRRSRLSPRSALFYAFFGAVAYGFAMECIQWAFFPRRSFEFWDIVANISGSIAALLVLRKRMV
jgi:VanZ family protein